MQLELKNIHKAYGQRIVFTELNIDFSNAGFYLLSGYSGSGKSTLLNILAGYEPFEKGERVCDGNMACIFQSYELIEELTVLENIRLGVDLHEQDFDEGLLIKLGISDFLQHYPSELSGGQKQRVGIARALYQNPDVILCDEPTESLDIDNKEIVLKLLKEMSKDKVVIIACHDLALIEPYYDYHYAIRDNKLVLIDQRREIEKCLINNHSYPYSRSMLRNYIYKIIHKRTLSAVVTFYILIVFQIGLYTLDLWLFTPKESLDALNGHVVYVNLFDEDKKIVEHIGIGNKPIVSFDPITIESKKYIINIYPLENNLYSLKENEILINTKVIDLFPNKTKENVLGQTMKVSFTINYQTIEKNYIVKEVIEEKDAYYPQIYYDYDALYNSLDTYLQNSLLENSSYYEVLTNPKKTEKIYQSLKDNPNILTMHSVLDMRKQNEGIMNMYHLLILIIEGMALIITIACILYFNKKDTDRNKTALSLIYGLGIPLTTIKMSYFTQKILYMIIGAVAIIICLLLVKRNSSVLPLELAVSYIGLNAFIYIISIGYQIIRFKSKNISMILKENKD